MRKSLLIGASALSMVYTAGALAEMPAVTGVNAKIEGSYGQLDSEDSYGIGGSVALPFFVEQLGLQADAAVGIEGEEENFAYGGGLSLNWRSSSVGSFGLTGVYLDVEDAAWIARYQADGELYLGDLTLGGQLGWHDSDWGQDAMYTGVNVTYYPIPNLALNAGGTYFGFDEEDLQVNLGAEVGLADVISVFANGKIGSESEDSFSIGLRFALGSSTSDLKKQDREFMRKGNVVNNVLSQSDMILKNAAAAAAAAGAGGGGGGGGLPLPLPL